MRYDHVCLTLFALAGGFAGCSTRNVPPARSPEPMSSPQVFQVTGVVQERKPDGRTVVIEHDEVPDYMPAMTMPFEVKDTNELAGVAPGDRVSFRMLVTETEGWIDQIVRLGTTNQVVVSRETLRRVRFVEPLNVGDPIPDYPFTNELNQPIRLSQHQGKALAFTFIFTRCPFPQFCPRMSGNFAEAYRRLTTNPDAPANWHLLSLSFDVEYDTPEVLRAYARQYNYDPERWSFATGALIDIDALTEQFGLMFPRQGPGILFNHNLRTVVVDARGLVHKIFIGNEWTTDELVAAIIEAAKSR